MRYGWKVVVIGVLTLLLLIPLLMLRGLVSERQQRANDVRAEIAGSSSREQRVVGPLLRVQIEELVRVRRKVNDNGILRDAEEQVRRSSLQVIAPEKLSLRNVLRTETRHRGLFSAMLYHDAAALSADFVWPAPPVLDEDRLAWKIVAADFEEARDEEARDTQAAGQSWMSSATDVLSYTLGFPSQLPETRKHRRQVDHGSIRAIPVPSK